MKIRAALQSVVALIAGVLGVVTIFWHDWIEAMTGWDPDHHNGAYEWLIVAALLVIAAVTGITARRGWTLAAAAVSSR